MVGDILQPTHLLFILVVALLVLGPKRLPEVGKSLGKGLRDFRQAISGEGGDGGSVTDFLGNPMAEDAPPAPAPAPAATAQAAPTAEQTAQSAAPVSAPSEAVPVPEPAGVAATPPAGDSPS